MVVVSLSFDDVAVSTHSPPCEQWLISGGCQIVSRYCRSVSCRRVSVVIIHVTVVAIVVMVLVAILVPIAP
jgi:hypothetical protein